MVYSLVLIKQFIWGLAPNLAYSSLNGCYLERQNIDIHRQWSKHYCHSALRLRHFEMCLNILRTVIPKICFFRISIYFLIWHFTNWKMYRLPSLSTKNIWSYLSVFIEIHSTVLGKHSMRNHDVINFSRIQIYKT